VGIQQCGRPQPIQIERSVLDDLASGRENRLNVHDSGIQEASTRDGLRGRTVAFNPVQKSAKKSPPRRYKLITFHLKNTAACEPAIGSRYCPEIAGPQPGTRLRNEWIADRHGVPVG
jgi:hypothetical protein